MAGQLTDYNLDGKTGLVIEGELNTHLATTRESIRKWETGFDGIACHHNGVTYYLKTGGDATVEPGTVAGYAEWDLNTGYDKFIGELDPASNTLPAAQQGYYFIAAATGTIDGLDVIEGYAYRCTTDGTPVSTAANWERYTVADDSTDLLNIHEILLEKTGITPVDVFIYDTRKDSDCGAWRHRTQSTSWYQEELNTATRGSRREFPSVAVIVAEDDTVTIYDADDPDLPMWMVFESSLLSSSQYAFLLSGAVNSATAFNGMLLVSRQSLNFCNFISDDLLYLSHDRVHHFSGADVSQRNTNTSNIPTSGIYPNRYADNYAVRNPVNYTSVTALHSSSIDQATELLGSTIFSANNRNGSRIGFLISPAGTLYYMSAGSSGNAVNSWFNGTALTIVVSDGSVHVWDDVSQISSDDVAADRTISNVLGTARIIKMQSIASNDGLTLFHENPSSPSDGLVSYITADYNTGWMLGDVKGAYLASTDTADLVADRSVNANDLTVVGSPTLTPVATGAELLKCNVSATDYLEITNAIISNTLYAYCWVETAADVWELQHGVLSSSPIEGVSVTGTTLTIAGNNPKSLLRITATTPSNYQIAKIYNDERKLFQENAQCTIYGASSSINDMDYDEVTDLLHVGTSDGRSSFDGLVRVDNTTESTSVIAAHDGLIVEA